MHYLVFHLTLADAIVCFVTMPMETIWRYMDEVPSQYTYIIYVNVEVVILQFMDVIYLIYIDKSYYKVR